MDIKRNGSRPSGKGPADYFTGSVRIDPLFQAPNPARVVGASTPRILRCHVLPHLIGPIAVATTTYVAAAIGLEATLSFLGIGVQPPDTSLGLLMKLGVGYAGTSWWLFYLPGCVILAIVLLVHLVGDGIQAAFIRDGGSR